MDLKHQMIWLLVLVSVGVLVCYVILTIQFFRKGITAIGLLCATCLLLIGGGLLLGVPVSLIMGWSKVRQLGVKSLMIVYTILVILMVVCFAVALAMAHLFPGVGRLKY
jgi:hypothetical protein